MVVMNGYGLFETFVVGALVHAFYARLQVGMRREDMGMKMKRASV